MELNDAESFGRAIRQVRKEAGLRQDELALASGTSVSFVVDVERGKSTVELGRVLRLTAALGMVLTASHPALHDDGVPDHG